MALQGHIALTCVIASAALHALWNGMLKNSSDPRLAAVGVVGMSSAITTLVAPFVVETLLPNTQATAWSLASGIFEAAYFITLAEAFKRAPLAIAYTVVRGGAMLVVWPISIALFHEAVTPLMLAGAALVAVGLALAQLRTASAADGSAPAPKIPIDLRYAYVCCVAVAGYHLCYDRALHAGMHPFALFDVAMWVSLPVTVIALGSAGRRACWAMLRRDASHVALVGAVCATSFLLFLSGLLEAGAGVGITLRNTSVLFAQVMSWAIGERPQRWQLLGAMAVCTGAALVGVAR